jgi:hypothetical protein
MSGAGAGVPQIADTRVGAPPFGGSEAFVPALSSKHALAGGLGTTEAASPVRIAGVVRSYTNGQPATVALHHSQPPIGSLEPIGGFFLAWGERPTAAPGMTHRLGVFTVMSETLKPDT